MVAGIQRKWNYPTAEATRDEWGLLEHKTFRAKDTSMNNRKCKPVKLQGKQWELLMQLTKQVRRKAATDECVTSGWAASSLKRFPFHTNLWSAWKSIHIHWVFIHNTGQNNHFNENWCCSIKPGRCTEGAIREKPDEDPAIIQHNIKRSWSKRKQSNFHSPETSESFAARCSDNWNISLLQETTKKSNLVVSWPWKESVRKWKLDLLTT